VQFNPVALREFLRLRMMSQAELTKRAGISAGYLSDLLKGTKSNPSRPTVLPRSDDRCGARGVTAATDDAAVVRVAAVAQALDVTPWCIYDRIKRGEIPVVTIGRAKRVPRWWLNEVLARPAEVAS
jgi:hypothetical protein